MSDQEYGFTLIELLVVVTIIVVLLALLTPAIEKAIYQAELAVCGAQLGSVAGGVTVYANSQKRSYPYRAGVQDLTNSNYQPRQLSGLTPNPGTNLLSIYDDRPELRDYVPLNAFFCPLVSKLKVADSQDRTIVYTGYSMFFGYRYRDSLAGKGMFKLGDRLGYGDHEFGTMATDHYYVSTSANYLVSAHPDSKNVLPHHEQENSNAAGLSQVLGVSNDSTLTLAEWSGFVNMQAVGVVDLNYAFVDASVTRLNDVWWDVDPKNKRHDDRLLKVPINLGSNAVTDYLPLPKDR